MKTPPIGARGGSGGVEGVVVPWRAAARAATFPGFISADGSGSVASLVPRPMAQINPPKPLATSRPDDLREDNLTTVYARSSMFFDEHRNLMIGVMVGIVALALAVIGWRYWQSQRSEEAQVYLGAILNEYNAGNWEAALDGTDTTPGLLEIADEYGSTATGEQATFFAADALFQLGRTDEALDMFEAYDGEDLLAASALGGQAAIYEQTGDPERAAGLYERAARAYESPASTPGYLLDAGRAYAAAGDTEAAQEAYQKILEDWDTTPEARTAQTELGMVEAMATATGTPTGDVQPAPTAPAATEGDSTAAN